MPTKPIFSENFLAHYLPDFRLSSVTNIRGLTVLIKGLIEELNSGKIEALKEEEIKPRFISTLFGDILGFNYRDSTTWHLKEEKKSTVDGTKPDAVLGYFYVDDKRDDVQVVIEIKDAATSLDKVQQSRLDKQTTVDQAFGYVAKAGGNCKWVIVSNIIEIRFYPALDRSKCQIFQLKDLADENKLKEFLFLFHKDRLIKKDGKSHTDKLFDYARTIQSKNEKPIHIIDKIYHSLKRFESFGFVDPYFLATISPFNILTEHVWHYDDENLFTINAEIHELLLNVEIENEEVKFSEQLQKELLASNVFDAKYKTEWSFKFLNHCLIFEITAIKDYRYNVSKNKQTIGFSHRQHFSFQEGNEGITKDICIVKSKPCDCMVCNYRRLDFNNLLKKLKEGEGNANCNTTEYAYGHYLAATNNFKSAYSIYKAIERETKGSQGRGVDYFLTKLNLKRLHNLLLSYEFADRDSIMVDIRSIDLDKVIYDEIEFDIDNEVKRYLLDVKEDVLIYKLQDEIEEINLNIDKLKRLYDNGGKQTSGPNLSRQLVQKYSMLYEYVNRNLIIYDIFIRYKSLTEKVFRGLITSYHIPQWGMSSFSEFILTEAILHIQPQALQEMLKIEHTLTTEADDIEKLLGKLNNFTTSIFTDSGLFGPSANTLLSAQLGNHRFNEKFTSIFSNFFTVQSRLEISKDQFAKSVKPLIKFLEIENELAWFELREFARFIFIKGDIFEAKDLAEILAIVINRHEYGKPKYSELLKAIPVALAKFHPEYKIDNVKLIKTALLNCSSEDEKHFRYNDLVYLTRVSNDNCKQILVAAFEDYLDKRFNDDFYESMLLESDYDYQSKNYFQLYSDTINREKDQVGIFKYGKLELTNVIFMGYVFVLYRLNIEFDRKELSVFSNLNDFETWILNPLKFDYTKFEAVWLTDLNHPFILDRLKGIVEIANLVEIQLVKEFNALLAQIKYKYFN